MTMSTPELILAGFGALGGLGGVTALVKVFVIDRDKNKAENSKSRAETVDVFTGVAIELVEPLRLELAKERAARVELERQVEEERAARRADRRQFEDELDRMNDRQRLGEIRIHELEAKLADREATIIQLRGTNGYGSG